MRKIIVVNQLFQTIPSEYTDKILCCYTNETNKIAIAQITNIPSMYFERVIFPKERFLFEVPPTAELEIYQYNQKGKKLLERIFCSYLRVNQKSKTNKELHLSLSS